MKIDMNELPEHISGSDAQLFEKTFEELDSGLEISSESQQRILSSVMRKAGYGMNITMKNRETAAKKEKDSIRTAEVSRHRFGGALAACIAAVLIAGTAGFAVFGGRLFETAPSDASEIPITIEQAEVPNVVLMTDSEAHAALEQAGFIPVKREMYDETEAGLAIKTNPEHGTWTDKGSEVVYYVSLGSFDAERSSREQLLAHAQELYDEAMSYHGGTIERFNKENGTEIELHKPDDSMSDEMLADLCEELEKIMDMSGDEFYDYLKSLCELAVKEDPFVLDNSDPEADTDPVITTVTTQMTEVPPVVEETTPAESDISDEELNPNIEEPGYWVTLNVPLPDWAEGVFIFDVCREAADGAAASKTAVLMKDYKDRNIGLDIIGSGEETLYVKLTVANPDGSTDPSSEAFVYGEYKVNFDTGEVKLIGELDEKTLKEMLANTNP